ncbi:ATP-dependent DNA helicase [Photobacterium indicum]|uniref:UvrD-like helicase C-terminal domain-containing protein n=1 Tax=Photobacterium indicum TaxID=81447 RepID=A0A2T3L8J7_9GAMM|nr:ATP-dependent RecD-like DNA helicase [Photobacterium indicum]PSV47326.1 hypothetical protein C9J47_10630 [Photobacterium indicum]
MKDAINKYCQATFNGASEPLIVDMGYRKFGTKFRKGDPVIFTKNNYEVDIQNGTLGKLISVTPDEKKGSFGEVVLDEGRTVLLTQDLLAKLDLAYGITLHKGQGSQFKRVLVAVENSGLVDHSWVYTGITRAEVELHLFGAEYKLISAITGLSAKYKRQTYLADLLKEHIEPLA